MIEKPFRHIRRWQFRCVPASIFSFRTTAALIVFLLILPVVVCAETIVIEKIHLGRKPYQMALTFSEKPSYKVIQSDTNEVVIAFKNARISRQLKTSGDARPFIERISLERGAGDVVSFIVSTQSALKKVYPRWDGKKRTLFIALNEPSKGKTTGSKDRKTPTREKSAQAKADTQGKPSGGPRATATAIKEKTKFKGTMDDLVTQLKEDPCSTDEMVKTGIELCEKKMFQRCFEEVGDYLKNTPEAPCQEQLTILKAYAFFNGTPEQEGGDVSLKRSEYFQDMVSYFPDSRYLPYALTGLGLVNLALQNDAEAKGYFKVVHNNYPGYVGMPEVLLELGRIYNRTRQSKQAITLFKKSISQFPWSSIQVDTSIELGKALYNIKDYKEAVNVLTQVVDSNEKIIYEKPDILILLGNASFNLGNTMAARSFLGKVYNLFPDIELNHEYLTKIGDTYRDEKDIEKALEIYRLVIEKYPGTSGFVLSTMRLADLSKDLAEKERMYKLIIDDFKDHSLYRVAMMRLAELYDREGEYVKCIAVVKDLLEEGAGILRKDALNLLEKTTISLFSTYLESEAYTDVLTHFEADKPTLERFKSPLFFKLVGDAYYQAHLNDPALVYYKEANDLYKKGQVPSEMIMRMAMVMEAKGMTADALKMFDAYITTYKASSKTARAYHHKGLIFAGLNQHEKAIEQYRSAIKLSATNEEKVRILIDEANAHKALENYRVVSVLLEQAIQILASGAYDDFKTIFYVHRNLGETYMKLKEYVKASEAFNMALKFADKEKSNADVTFMLGDAYQKADYMLKAAEAFETVVKSGDAFWGRLADERLKEIKVEKNLQKS